MAVNNQYIRSEIQTRNNLVFLFKNHQQHLRQHALNAFDFASKIELRALNGEVSSFFQSLSDENSMYEMAYNVYRTIAENGMHENEIRGYASYRMWCLVQDVRVLLCHTPHETKVQRIQSFLVWAAHMGCLEAKNALKQQIMK